MNEGNELQMDADANERTLERRFSLSHQATVVPLVLASLLSGVAATRRGLLFELLEMGI